MLTKRRCIKKLVNFTLILYYLFLRVSNLNYLLFPAFLLNNKKLIFASLFTSLFLYSNQIPSSRTRFEYIGWFFFLILFYLASLFIYGTRFLITFARLSMCLWRKRVPSNFNLILYESKKHTSYKETLLSIKENFIHVQKGDRREFFSFRYLKPVIYNFHFIAVCSTFTVFENSKACIIKNKLII